METLREWLDRVEPIEPEDRDGVPLKLFFGAFGDPDVGRRQVLEYRAGVERRLATYREIERSFDDERGAGAPQGVALLAEARARTALLDWLRAHVRG
jgi:Virulence activator alpha C-term